ncbi:MAG: hypothetical protein HOP12_12685 [Candidatus Eisenbacteria bacterium]|uniref:Yip1 domain-containing protein n=1 Tax=Eiseniibacteriota bacterium TaxID=2212470 RepID=A0A849SMJ1_UNCEI|nr:hypothetical protein [Candidatus Eisenbacteria bacterium]
MLSPDAPPTASPVAASEPMPSLIERAVAIFARPTRAWAGLERPRWWFPLAVMIVVQIASTVVLYERAVIPMIRTGWEQAVEAGQMPAERVDELTAMMTQPLGWTFSILQQAVTWVIMSLVGALMVWFGVGFVLGHPMKYRQAFEVNAWSSLIMLPAIVLTGVIAWSKGTLRGVHLGFAALLPETETPTKLLTGSKVFLDGVGPFAVWCIAVTVIGASALTGAPRRSVAWVVGALYVGLMLFIAALAGMFTPGS